MAPTNRVESRSRVLLGCACAALATGNLCSSTGAQQVILQWDGPQMNDSFGDSLAASSDVTGDGIPDLIVGAPAVDCAAKGDGGTYVYSGRDGTLAVQLCGTVDQFGVRVSSTDDVDGDGFVDLLVGAISYDSPSIGQHCGRACVYSGHLGTFLYEVDGEQQLNELGLTVAGIGDIDEDGRGDFMTAAPSYDWYTPNGIGRAYIYSGGTGSLIRLHQGEAEYDYFGWNGAGVGDVDLDGVGDYAIMAELSQTNDNGAVYVYSGKSGAPLYKWTGSGDYDDLGMGLDGRVDWNGDGYGDILVGCPHNLSSKGHLYIYSGRDGSVLADVKGEFGEFFGYRVVNVGDMNRDGYPEILVSAPWNSQFAQFAGRASLLSGRTLRELFEFRGMPRNQFYFGTSSGGGLDYNSDSIPDLIIGTPGYNGTTSGRVTVFAGNDLFLQPSDYEVTAGDLLTLSTRGGPAGALTVLVLTDVNGIPTFLPLVLSTLDSNDESAFTRIVPPGFAGITLAFQAFAQKSPTAGGVIDSSTETITIY